MRAPRGGVAALVLLLTGMSAAACTGEETPPPPPREETVVVTDWTPAPREVDGLRVLAESDRDGFRLHTASGEKTFLPGVNLGSSLPLHQPGEIDVIQAEDYRRWLQQMGDLGIRVVRIYTLHPPAFYRELAAYNEANPTAPLYLVQGVYLPDESYVEEGGSLYDPAVDDTFAREIKDVSDAVHGDLRRKPAPGAASGRFDTDVSAWLASWIVGVEWEPAATVRTNELDADTAYQPGSRFAATPEASATERWIARHMDALAGYEAERGASVPIALANWPTTDPLEHPEEPLESEDLVGVDANNVLPTAQWPGGTFASFHAYPYYPDFQRYEPGLDAEEWNGKPDRYAGYLRSLQDHFADTMPLLVTEFGVPSSIGSAHDGTNGRGQGGHNEQTAMAMNADMMRMMESIGLGGAFVFAWTDEWFKRTWNTMGHQLAERRQLWHDPLTNEQHFGLVATDPDPLVDAAVEDLPEDLGAASPYEYLYTWADASFVHLDVTMKDALPRRLVVEADVLPGRRAADYRVVVDTGAGTARLEVRRALDPMRLDVVEEDYHPDQDDPWHLYRLIINRPFPELDLPAEYQEVGELVHGLWDPEAGDDYDSQATWLADEQRRTVRLRLPWSMLGMADPSSRVALGEGKPAEMVPIKAITFDFDADGATHQQRFRWRRWNHTTYTERPKAGLDVLTEAMTDLAP
ncbi:hypothetical protein [Nocardioides sp.]|uniref:hypothetical protein n=1 Tax=Nocardioides sp. TaxID=35761 RepID=UPI00273268AC|nr:hypothetical protein [Nocardioides sp.]MDP3890480.1 hypothetical protein [Nocardioides sp.]